MVLALALTACSSASVPSPGSSTASTPTSGGSLTTTSPSTTTPTTAPSPTTTSPRTTTSSRPVTTKPSTPPRSTSTSPRPTSPASTVCSLPAGLLGRDIEALPTSAKVVALTFDAGANADGAASILATLSAKGAPGTFFLTGAFVQAFPSQSRAIAQRYPVGNHTQTHPDLTTLSDAQVLNQIRTARTTIRSVTGQDPRPYFRFPFGARTAHAIALANAECSVPFRWTVDTLGWKGTSGGLTATIVHSRVLAGLRPGEVVLMHLGSNPDDHTTLDATALPGIIDAVRAQGYRFVTLEQVLPAAP